ncbi:gastric triacylglycerol lipase-like [Mytilus trossulus]|uniref:gastric triacylglycerol lipase-like n=1 Tax=Mytilus trossulus TaxID=6551 RepID=UPI0030075770
MDLLLWSLITTFITTSNGFSPLYSTQLRKGHDVSPEVFMNSVQLIAYNGYKAETHFVPTEDGFILGVHRIPYGRNDKPGGSKPVVLLQHGLLADSSCYLFNGYNGSLGFILADAGYDVWLGNSRGNTYSMKHTKYNSTQEQFWDFSWQDMADKDLPAMVDYTLKTTNQTSLVYIGHSQGTLTGFTGFSRNRQLAKKVKLFIALAPIAKLADVRGITSLLVKALKPNIDEVFTLFGRKGFFLNNSINMDIADKICDTDASAFLCSEITDLIYGHGLPSFDWRRVPVYMSHIPSGTSVRNMVHFGQGVISGEFQLYDFGTAVENMARYNQTTPPYVNITQVDVPVALYSGGNDYLADPTDVKFISANLKHIVENKEYPKWNHADFVVGDTPPKTLYKDMLKLLGKLK